MKKDNFKSRQIITTIDNLINNKNNEIPVAADYSNFNDSLLNIQKEIQRIIKENLKFKDENELSRSNSDVVIVERYEFVIASSRKKSKSDYYNSTNTEEIIEFINTSLKRLNELTKPQDHSSIYF